jgi:hypothetical protein
VSEEK